MEKELKRWVFQGEPELSPLAASKDVHKISVWISTKTKQMLNEHQLHCKLYKKPHRKSEIIAEALSNFCYEDYNSDKIREHVMGIVEPEKPHKITFYLKPKDAQHLWDIEGCLVGDGTKTSISSIVNFALAISLE
jgi:hypothetical protein